MEECLVSAEIVLHRGMDSFAFLLAVTEYPECLS